MRRAPGAGRRAPVGRVGVVVGGIPVVVPVNFALLDEDVVFRTSTGHKLVAAIDRSAVSFEVDSLDLGAGAGWSVLITGGASEITRADHRARPARSDSSRGLPAGSETSASGRRS